jgi:hypothetical protein
MDCFFIGFFMLIQSFNNVTVFQIQRKDDVGTQTKKHEETDKEAVHREDTFKMVLPFDCMDIHMFNNVKSKFILPKLKSSLLS